MIYIYARVSTIEQAGSHQTSLAEQARKCKGLADAYNPTTFDVQVIEDVVSGSLPLARRPGGGKMIAMLQPGDTIVAAKLDRIFRSAVDALLTIDRFKEQKVNVILADFGVEPIATSPIAYLFFSMLSSFAEFERHRIAERMQDGKRAKKAQGGAIGGMAPFGWRVVGEGKEARLESNESEAAIVAEMVDLWEKNDFRPNRVVTILADKGVRNRAGGLFKYTHVERIVKRERARLAVN